MSIKNLDKLSKLVSCQESHKGNNRTECLLSVNENDNYYVASDSFRAGIIFKGEDKTLRSNFNNSMDMIVNLFSRCENMNESSITLDRKSLKKNLNVLFKESKEKLKGIKFLHKSSTTIHFVINYVDSTISYFLEELEGRILTDPITYENKVNNKYFEIAVCFQYLEEGLNLLQDKNITINYNSCVNPITVKEADREILVMPVRLLNNLYS